MSNASKPHGLFEMFIPERHPGHPSVRGRPKGAVNAKPILVRIAFMKHKIKEHGKMMVRTTLELIILILQREAMSGNHRAAAIRDRYFSNYLEPDLGEGEKCGILLVPAGMSAEEWIEDQKRKNVRNDALMQEIQREEAVRH